MKIGILTYHAVYNFGANLQALSTFNYLKKKGYSPILIDFFPEQLEEDFEKSVPKLQAGAHKKFLSTNFCLTGRCRNSTEIAREIESHKIEAVIIGSDAVVQHHPLLARIRFFRSRRTFIGLKILPRRYETSFPNPFWGEFISHLTVQIPVVMMSVSCQNSDYRLFSNRTKKSIKAMTERIKYISVRDLRTQQLFKFVTKGIRIPTVTPDPVFAFNSNVKKLPARREFVEKFGLPDQYFLLSFNSTRTVSEEWIDSFESLAEENGYSCVGLAMPGGIRFRSKLKIQIDIPIDPIEWYCLIKYSSGYIGEKMHPVIVSIHNSIPFFSFDHYGIVRFKYFIKEGASKIFQLLDRAGMKEQRATILGKTSYKPPSPQYVYDKVISFNREKCSVVSFQMLNEYSSMMSNIEHFISEK